VKLFVCTADASGDMHAAALLEALRRKIPDLEAFGLGGANLVAQGLDSIVDQAELAVAGLFEVLGSAPRVLRAYAALRRALRERRPDVAVFVDSPDLNLRLAAVAKRLGIPVLYYVAPQVWAWRPGRVRVLAERVDHVAVIFPFEEPLLRDAGIEATFVGHPLVDRMAALRARLDPWGIALDLHLDLGRPVLGLLPGSRRNEIAHNLELFVETARLLLRSWPELQVRLLVAPTLAAHPPVVPAPIEVVVGRTHEAMSVSTCLLAAPGTVTVEAALLGVPTVVSHRLSPASFELVRRVARVPSSCMVNLIADEGIVPERIQQLARPVALAGLVSRILRDPSIRQKMREDLARATERLGPPGAAERTAELVLRVARRE
jgi:lipid-A-disaccharide synthase